MRFSNNETSLKFRGHRNIKTTLPAEMTAKYGNRKTIVDGIKFDSAKEAKRWGVLKLMERAGEISNLQRQVKFELNEGGTHSVKYIADFVYWKKGQTIVEDCKGFRTAIYKKKKKLMLKVHHIEILET